jgi:hypothetical protein
MVYFAIAVGGVQQCRNAAGKCGDMVCDAKLPGIRQEDGDNISGHESGGDKTARERFDGASIVSVREASID